MIDLNQSYNGGSNMKLLWNVLKKILIISLALCAAAYWADTRETGSTNNPISVNFPQATNPKTRPTAL